MQSTDFRAGVKVDPPGNLMLCDGRKRLEIKSGPLGGRRGELVVVIEDGTNVVDGSVMFDGSRRVSLEELKSLRSQHQVICWSCALRNRCSSQVSDEDVESLGYNEYHVWHVAAYRRFRVP